MQVEKDSGKLLSAKYTYKHLQCAISLRLGYIHQSGHGYTHDRNQAWTGTKQQFKRLCEVFDHDPKEFQLFPIWWLTRLSDNGNKRQH